MRIRNQTKCTRTSFTVLRVTGQPNPADPLWRRYNRGRDRGTIGGVFMKEERTITQFARVPTQRLSWSAIFGGTFFALGIMIILSLFGVAVGAAVSGVHGVTQGVKIWAG